MPCTAGVVETVRNISYQIQITNILCPLLKFKCLERETYSVEWRKQRACVRSSNGLIRHSIHVKIKLVDMPVQRKVYRLTTPCSTKPSVAIKLMPRRKRSNAF